MTEKLYSGGYSKQKYIVKTQKYLEGARNWKN